MHQVINNTRYRQKRERRFIPLLCERVFRRPLMYAATQSNGALHDGQPRTGTHNIRNIMNLQYHAFSSIGPTPLLVWQDQPWLQQRPVLLACDIRRQYNALVDGNR